MQLNPHHPGWYHYVAFTDAYRRRDYRGALASRPEGQYARILLAARGAGCCLWAARRTAARAAALQELQALMPNFGAIAREEFGKWHDAELTEHLLDARLRKAGLKIAGDT